MYHQWYKTCWYRDPYNSPRGVLDSPFSVGTRQSFQMYSGLVKITCIPMVYQNNLCSVKKKYWNNSQRREHKIKKKIIKLFCPCVKYLLHMISLVKSLSPKRLNEDNDIVILSQKKELIWSWIVHNWQWFWPIKLKFELL